MLTADDPKVQEFLHVWHEACRADFERSYPRLQYDTNAHKSAKERRKYIALDRYTSGVYLVDRLTGAVYTIKAYGVPNRHIGTLDSLIAFYSSPKPWLAVAR